jgi:hypothetical protein
MDADQLTLELAQDAPRHSMQRLVVPLRVLVACESSGTVRDAFNRLGHVATSCDMLETERPGDHYTGDVRDILANGWDLIIAHPPCTFLNVAAAWAFGDPDYDKFPGVGYHQKVKPGTLVGEARRKAQAEALDFVRLFMDADCPRIAIENPVGAISSSIRKADQYIHPHQFGDDASKTTGLWLKGLPKLQPTANVPPRMVDGKPRWANQCDNGQNKLTPSPDRWRERSKTYQGIADAMALQWGGDTGWRRVSFAGDCESYDDEYEDTGELGNVCSLCGCEYDTCPCPGPTQDGMEYETFHGVLMARPILGDNDKDLARRALDSE